MAKKFNRLVIFLLGSFTLLVLVGSFNQVKAQTWPTTTPPEPCRSNGGPVGQPPEKWISKYCIFDEVPKITLAPNASQGDYEETLSRIRAKPEYKPKDPAKQFAFINFCANNYETWLQHKDLDFWVNDPEITALGKGGERSRQFLYWTLTHSSDDDSPNILSVWQLSRNIAYFLILIIAIFMGLGIIVSQRANFSLDVEISPLIIKLIVLLLYITFSAAIVLAIIQVADIMMEFFIRSLGVIDLFNIFLFLKI